MLRRCFILSTVILGLFIMNCKQAKIQPPVAKRIDHRDTLFGDVRVDPYFWLRDRENPEVIRYLEAENAYTEAMMAHTKPLQEKLFEEMVGRIKQTDLSVPVKRGSYFYYYRTQKGKQYVIHCRKKGSLDAPEEVLLDENELAQGHKFFRIGVLETSPDHRYLAFSVDTTGNETYTMYVKDLQTGRLLADTIENTYYTLAWANDNQTFFYTVLDAAKRPYKLYRHRLGQPAAQDQLVHHEKDDKFFISVRRSKSGRFIFLELESQVTAEVRYLSADRPQDTFRVFKPRRYNVEYSLFHQGDYFYILTNEQAVNFKLMRTPIRHIEPDHWQVVIAHDPKIKLETVEPFKNFLVVLLRDQGLKQIRVQRTDDGEVHFVRFEEPVYTVSLGGNEEYDSETLRFTYQSLITPPSVY
ncbi:MAG: S9 family peptidase, partial [Calditrichaeota bacterium]